MKPQALILRAAGVNCDAETAHAFELAGARSEFVHLKALIESPKRLHDFQMLAIPGGFSYGDDIAAGKILANQLAHHLREPLAEFIAAGKPIIGICNGFQVLVKTDLLPGSISGNGSQLCTLTNNDCGRFVDRWIHLASRSSKCIWTAGLAPLELPIAHGEGKFVPKDDGVRRQLWDNDQVALVYTKPDGSAANGQFPDNPNGSVDDIAGICDPTGLVFGLMPHPERHVSPFQHPAWTSRWLTERARAATGPAPGLSVFANAVRHVASAVGAGI
jgi:phosphoribosylformylglycinamidine synthase